ncbi:MAG: tRNA (N6-isopentenyl adenosine(37)-C2)-methylthiotransferase MiaB [Omnitrophica WOR_2 bacterium RIFCSPHIGHO2_02_FULL_52_10]|nr:MAG: tRNA (N6-isopentenyl adenosine(37)-C2)-methylthiotransferase MiaB [Omnitrophica WOR_2 bacterium RIFCSPHIGHO2_02_FULL_52_10]
MANQDATTGSITSGKRLYIETYGCQMNEYDSELVRAILKKENYTFVPSEDEADIIMLNTCAIREHAHRKIFGRIHQIHHSRKFVAGCSGLVARATNNERPLIGILGCMATNLRTELLENKSLKIDFIAGPDSYKRLPQLISEAMSSEQQATSNEQRKPFDITLSEFETYSDIFPQPEGGVGAFVSVQRGCNNFCTFCVVPYTRGRERSRAVDNVVEECQRLADSGFQQITLLGQNVNSYRHENNDFADLIEAVSQVKGIRRIRFTSPHPKDFPDKLLDIITNNPKACKHIPLPLQSGNDRVLELMNRTYTRREFLALVDKIRAKCPKMALSTDIIVGFSSETDAEFEDTYKAMEQVEFDSAFIFKYSERKHTIAQRSLKDDVPDAIKTERIVALNELQKDICLTKNSAHIGETHAILIENTKAGKTGDRCVGRTDGHTLVTLAQGTYNVGDWVSAKITAASPNGLKGKAV